MAVGDNKFQTYTAVGNREDLTDVITNISPMDTWFTTNSGTSSAKATYHEWQTDALADAAANVNAEGAAFSDAALTATTRVGNYTQIMKKDFMITKTQEAVDSAGRKSEIAYQTEKKSKELARDLEYALLINATSAVGSAGSARQLKGVLGWIATNVSSASATGIDLTEALLNDNLQKIWEQGGKPSTVLVGAYNKRKISSFTTNTRYMVADEAKLASAVDVYQSDFGTVTIRLHQILNAASPGTVVCFGDMSLWEKAWLRKITRTSQPYAGDADAFTLLGELTLVSRQEKGAGKIISTKSS